MCSRVRKGKVRCDEEGRPRDGAGIRRPRQQAMPAATTSTELLQYESNGKGLKEATTKSDVINDDGATAITV